MPNVKRKIALQFPSLKEMTDYMAVVNIEQCEIVHARLLLLCELADRDIELALHGYKAVEIEKPL